MAVNEKWNFNIVLFENFDTLDAFGPVEILARHENHQMNFYSWTGGAITSVHGVSVNTLSMDKMSPGGVLLLPGGIGTRTLLGNEEFLSALGAAAEKADYCLSVCTGSAVLAKAGILDGRVATSNKLVFDWVTTNSDKVKWQRSARWTVDGKYYTASGVSAGMDMALGFLADIYDLNVAEEIANYIEYIWNRDREQDPFA